jgi:DNA-binding MarR family transcriptional regulator
MERLYIWHHYINLYIIVFRAERIRNLNLYSIHGDDMSEKLRKQALRILAEGPLTLKELAERMGIKEKKAFEVLRFLFESGEVDCYRDADSKRRYRLSRLPEDASKGV